MPPLPGGSLRLPLVFPSNIKKTLALPDTALYNSDME